MTQEEKVVERVKKLLELSKSENVNESATAAAQAQKLMTKHSITELMLEKSDEKLEEAIEDAILYAQDKQMPQWYGRLCMKLCGVNQCDCYQSGNQLKVVGRPSDAQTVRYLFSYISKEIIRLRDQHSEERGEPGRRWRNDFCIGATAEVNNRLYIAAKEARAEMKREADASDTMGTGTAIVLVNNALAKLDKRGADVGVWVKKNLKLQTTSSSRRYSDRDGRTTGQLAGRNIDIGAGGRGSIGSGSKKRLTQ